MFFDGSCSKEGVGTGIVLISPLKESSIFSCKLEFETTNNVVEYEALLIGLKKEKDMNISEIYIFGDVELIIWQIRNVYQTKHPRLKEYWNAVWDIVEDSFLAFNISFVPRESNILATSLSISAISFKITIPIKLKYEVEVRFRPHIPHNVKHWKSFED